MFKNGRFRVQKKLCATCIYRPENADMLPRLEQQCVNKHGFVEGFRVCHHSNDVRCRGYWNKFKDQFQAGQLAQRLKLVIFVTVDTLGGKRKGTPKRPHSKKQKAVSRARTD